MARAIQFFQFELICVSARTQITQAFLGIHEHRRVARECRTLLASDAALLASDALFSNVARERRCRWGRHSPARPLVGSVGLLETGREIDVELLSFDAVPRN